ncbi:MAG: PDZ domain-containing protein [Ignavibacteriales bacterium]|nr:PDZ domain-containing protein [Ignavibacteriales bacterium]
MKNRRIIPLLAALMVVPILGWAFQDDAQDRKPSSRPGWLGVSIQDITSGLKKSMDLKTEEGALVGEVTKKSPAEEAGVKEGDVIVQFGTRQVEDTYDLQRAVSKTEPGTKVSLVVLRKGEKKTLSVTVGKAPRVRSFAFAAPRGGRIEMFGGTHLQGLRLKELNEQLAEYFGAPEKKGVLVEEVDEESAAAKAGIKAGDVLVQIGKKKIDEIRDVSRALGAYDEGETVEVEVLRKGAKKTVSLEVGEEEDGWGYQFFSNPGHLRQQREFHFNEVPDIDIRIPRIEVDHIRPDLEELKFHLQRMREDFRRDGRDIREKIEREIKPKVKVRVHNEI